MIQTGAGSLSRRRMGEATAVRHKKASRSWVANGDIDVHFIVGKCMSIKNVRVPAAALQWL
jgi:hypothetical protein